MIHSEYLQVEEHYIPYRVVKNRRSTIELQFNQDAVLIVKTVNGRITAIEREFIRERWTWLINVQREHQSLYKDRSRLLAEIERKAPILGIDTAVEFAEAKETSYRFKKGEYFIVMAPKQFIAQRRKELLFWSLRKYAEAYLERRTQHWLEVCNMSINRLRVKDVKSKWGSCSSLRNVNLNWHLILLEEPLIDYIIVHELMHLHEMNHSKRFWNWVGKYIPDYKEKDKRLNEKAWLIGILS